jgi:hypothetical protein
VKLVGWILLLGGAWSIARALTADEPLGAGGVLMAAIGLALVSARGRQLAAWIGEGLVTGFCFMAGAGLAAVGLAMVLVYGQVLAEGMILPVRDLTVPLLFLGCGLLLILLAVTRLIRQYRRR